MVALCESDAECCGDLSSLSSSETGTEATEHESTSSCVSLLDRLRSPKPSELAHNCGIFVYMYFMSKIFCE